MPILVLLALMLAASPAGTSPGASPNALTITVRARPPLQVGEMTEVVVTHRNTGRAPLRVATERACSPAAFDRLLLDGEDAAVPTVTSCPGEDTLETRTLGPGKTFTTELPLVPNAAGAHRLQAVYRAEGAPEGIFADEVRSAPVEIVVAPPDPDGPVVELSLPKRLRAGRPFTVTLKHVNRGSRGWILYNERCGGFPRDFVVVDGVERPIHAEPRCRSWDHRMTLEPGRTFHTRLTLTLPAGDHTLQGRYRLGDEYREAVVWKGEAVSPVVTVTVAP